MQTCSDSLYPAYRFWLPSLKAWQSSARRSATKQRTEAATVQQSCASRRGVPWASRRSTATREHRRRAARGRELPPGRRSAITAARGVKALGGQTAEVQRHADLPALEQALQTGQAQEAHQAFVRLQQTQPDAFADPQLCGRTLRLLCREKDFRKTWEVYQHVKPVRLGYSALANVMSAAIRAGEIYRALEVFRDIQARGLQPNITSWCHLISAFNRSRKQGWPFAQTAFELWQELQAEGGSALGDADASSYATGMMALAGVGRLAEAEALLGEMRAAGHAPDIRAYNILLAGAARAGRVSDLPRLLDAAAAAGLAPSAATRNTLVDAYASAGMLAEAEAVMRSARVDGVRPDTWAYSSLMKGFVRSGRLEDALQLLEEMEALGTYPNVVTLTTLVDGCVRAGSMAQAEDILAGMRQRRVQANVITYNTLLRGYAVQGDLEAVRGVLQRMGDAGVHPREDTFNTLMDGALRARTPELVPQLFRQLVNLDLRPSSLSYTALITALARMSQPDSAIEAFGKLEADWGLCGIALNALVAALANANRITEAEEQLQRAADFALDQGQPPPIEAYGALLKAYSRFKDADSAMDLFREFQTLGGEPDDRLVDDAVAACIRAQQFKRALQFVRAMERRGKNIDRERVKATLETVIRSEVRARKLRPGAAAQRSENVERLKFWLGLPNSYYGSDSERA